MNYDEPKATEKVFSECNTGLGMGWLLVTGWLLGPGESENREEVSPGRARLVAPPLLVYLTHARTQNTPPGIKLRKQT